MHDRTLHAPPSAAGAAAAQLHGGIKVSPRASIHIYVHTRMPTKAARIKNKAGRPATHQLKTLDMQRPSCHSACHMHVRVTGYVVARSTDTIGVFR